MVIRQLGVTPAYNKTGQQLLSSAGPLKTSPSSSLINQVSWQSLHWTFFCNSKEVREKTPKSAKYTANLIWQGLSKCFPYNLLWENTNFFYLSHHSKCFNSLNSPYTKETSSRLIYKLNRSSQLQKNLNCSQIKD